MVYVSSKVDNVIKVIFYFFLNSSLSEISANIYLTPFKNLELGGLVVEILTTLHFLLKHFFPKWYPIKPVPPTISIFFLFKDFFLP